jgi:hypothetical protein
MPPPITTPIVPPVTASALAETNSSLETNKGNPAESPANINRLIPKAINTKSVRRIPVVPLLINIAIATKTIARITFAI